MKTSDVAAVQKLQRDGRVAVHFHQSYVVVRACPSQFR